ncbi:MAG: tripartite tricarboxylate transporter substrate binding protein [Betaproteobacteria bacterium]|nr:tripartite tricarboxylate transporter substrate binding protein [Betaproteobacteria bacterium]
MQRLSSCVVIAFCAVCGIAISSTAWPQSYPAKPVRLVVPFAPGGAADIIARAMNEPLNRALGQTVIIENKPGAGSSLAVDQVAKSAPDGYTVVIASQSGIAVNPIINKNVGYDVEKDLTAIIQVTRSPLVIAVHPSVSARTVSELIAEAKKTAGKLNFATSGNGSLPHLATMIFSGLTGADMVHVPYKSGGLAVASVVAGDTHLTFATSPSVMPQVQAGRLRGIAVTTRARSPLVTGLPGMEESGLKGYDVSIWYGFFVPSATPRPVVVRIFESTSQALRDPKFREIMAKDGTETPGSKSPEEFATFVREEVRVTAKAIRDSGAKFD